ncbi:glycosyltransferase family 9 protein, partial [Acidobacteriota bacterium]
GGWSSKLWPVEGYIELARWILKETDLGVFINCGPGEEVLAQKIKAAVADERVADFTTTLREYIHLARHAAVYVGSDSGPYHIAMALGVRAVGIFGPSDPEICGPWDLRNPVVWNRDECAPCYKRTCAHPKCMTDIKPSSVISAVIKALDNA